MVDTHIQPIRGIANWKSENTPATVKIFDLFIHGSLSPFARDTEKASIARPIPRRILLKKNEKLNIFPPKTKNTKLGGMPYLVSGNKKRLHARQNHCMSLAN